MKKDVKTSRRFPVLTAACAAAAVACLALAGVYAYAKYATSSESALSADTDFLSVTSSMTFKDAGGEAEAIGGDIGVVLFGGDAVTFTVTLENTGRVAARCAVEIDDWHSFVTVEGACSATIDGAAAVVAVSDKALSLSEPLPAGSVAVMTLAVTSDEGYSVPGYGHGTDEDTEEGTEDTGPGMYSKTLEFTFVYGQAD